MGSIIEFNDTLQISQEQGFPAEILDIEKYQQTPIQFDSIKDKIFEFKNKCSARLFHTPPTRCFLVQNLNGKWIHWGKIEIIEQTISSHPDNSLTTSGKFKITELYSPEQQIIITKNDSKPELSYF
jgi:hypothetical protein